MGIKIDIVGDNATSVVDQTVGSVKVITKNIPVVATSNSVEVVTIDVLKGAKGDDKVYAGPTPPENPQEGWIWIKTNG